MPTVFSDHGLLLPFCVRPYSSPDTTIGTPRARKVTSQKFRQRVRRSAWSPPESQLMLLSEPPSDGPNGYGWPLSLVLYETRSNIVKPSWAVTKFTDFCGPPESLKCSQSPLRNAMKSSVLPSPLR